MAQSAPQIVGRAAELAALDHAIDALAGADGGGGAGALLIVGGPGIGKSRLLTELGRRAEAKGQLVLAGSASELERDLPFGVFVDALDEYVEGLEPRRLQRLDDDVRFELARVFPALSGIGGHGAEALQDERYRTHRAVRTLLETLAVKPLVLILDDFHWTDSASIELAGALLRRPPAARVLLVLGSRPRQLSDRLTAELARAERGGMLTRLALEPLSFEDACALLGDGVSPAAARGLYEESGGVPFYLEQLARMAGGGASPSRSDGSSVQLGGADVPPMVVAALSEELALLSEDGRRVLQGAAIAGDPFAPELAAAAAGVSEATAVDALDELLRLDFVRATDVPRRFRFRHPLVRRAVYEAAPGGWRLAAHERAAAALAERQASAGARAHHVERSARQGNLAAVALLREAGEQAAGRAPGTAARWFDGALRLLPDAGAEPERSELLLLRSHALAAVGRLRESHAALEESLRLAPAGEPALRARLTAACAAVERYLGLHGGANARLTKALDETPAQSREAVALILELALDGFYRIAFDDMNHWARRAVSGAEALGEPGLIAAAYALTTMAGAWTGKLDDAEAARVTAVRLVDALSDEQLATRLDAAMNLAAAEFYMDHFPDSARHAERVRSVGRATGQGQLFPAMYAVLGGARWMDGRLAEAGELFGEAIEAARLRDDAQGLAWTLFNGCAVALHAGDLDGALDMGRESVELSASMDAGMLPALAAAWYAMARLESGDAQGAVDLMLESAGGESLALIPGGWRVMYLDYLTRALLDLGQLDAARRAAACGRAWAAQVGLPFPAAMADRSEARIELAAGNPAAAAALALSSVGKAEAAGATLDAALGRIVAGRALAAAGERDHAVEILARAVRDTAGFGAVRHRAAAERELRMLGETVSRRARDGAPSSGPLGALTGRELEIARLTVERMTNKEIAGRLFLSEKTIETHMRNIFHKLGVGSRVDVARAIERADRAAVR